MYSYRSVSSTKRMMSRTLSTSAASSSSYVPPILPRSDLSYRALLRNLRILQGMRPTLHNLPPKYNVIVTGYDAKNIAKDMSTLEPCIAFEVVGDSVGIDTGKIMK